MALKTDKDLSENARGLWLKALSAVELRNYGYAVSLLQPVLKEAPEFLDARKVLRKAEVQLNKGKKSLFGGISTSGMKGNQLLKKGDAFGAMEHAEEILQADPFSPQGNHLLKDAALKIEQYETAVFALQTLAEGDPKDTKVLHELGELYLKIGQPDKAVNVYTKIVEINPADLIAVKRSKDAAATNSMKSGGWETAKDYRDLIKNKEEAVSLEQKNRVVKSEEMIDQQLAEMTEQAQREPENIDLARRIAGLYEQKLDIENAIAWYNFANELAKGTDNWLLRKVSDLQLKQIEVAVKEREEWLAVAGDDHEESPRIRQEIEDYKAQRNSMLLDEARKRVERNPTDLQFRYEYGEQLMNSGHFNEAVPELQKARNNPNVRLKAMSLLGQCYTGKGMLDLAVKQFSDAAAEILAMDVTKKDILYKLGLVYDRMGQKDKALDCFKQIYEVDYGYEDVAQRVESSYSAS